jgi:hypothetical protein
MRQLDKQALHDLTRKPASDVLIERAASIEQRAINTHEVNDHV